MVFGYLRLKRLDEAQAAAYQAVNKHLDSGDLRLALYQIAFLRNDQAGMVQQDSWAKGKAGIENAILLQESNTAAYSGKLKSAHEISRRAEEASEQAGEKEMAAGCEASAAMWDA